MANDGTSTGSGTQSDSVIPDVYSFEILRTGEYYKITVDKHGNKFTGGWYPFTVAGYCVD